MPGFFVQINLQIVWLTAKASAHKFRALMKPAHFGAGFFTKYGPMKVRSSLKSLKNRHRDCKVVRRKGRVYVINKTDPRFKARQG